MFAPAIAIPQEPSRYAALLDSASRLPPALANLFQLCFVQCLTDEQVAAQLRVGLPEVARQKTSLIRSLKSTVA